jgi:hypothetical protein
MGISVYRLRDGIIEERRNINSVDMEPYLNDGWTTEMPFLELPKKIFKESPKVVPAESIAELTPVELPERKPPDSPALALINSATLPSELRILPSIGDAAAKIILEDRPEKGYEALQDLSQRIFEGRFKTNLEAIQGWIPG